MAATTRSPSAPSANGRHVGASAELRRGGRSWGVEDSDDSVGAAEVVGRRDDEVHRRSEVTALEERADILREGRGVAGEGLSADVQTNAAAALGKAQVGRIVA